MTIETSSWIQLLDDFQNLASAWDAVAPNAIEIGDQRLDRFGTDQRLRLGHIGELVKGVVDRGIAPAPEAPGPLGAKGPEGPGQVVGRIPMVERRPIDLVGNLGAY